MITTFTGSNHFLLQQSLNKHIDEFTRANGDHGLERLDGSQLTLEAFRSAVSSISLFTQQRCIIVHNAGSIPEIADAVAAFAEQADDTTDVIFVEPTLDKRTQYARQLKKHTDYKEFSDLNEYELSQWLLTVAQELGAHLQRQTADYLVKRVGPNQWLLHNEVHKLATYDSNITIQTIDMLTEPTPQSSIFALIDAIFSGQPKRALELYDDQRLQKIEPQQVLAMMLRQLHLIALVYTAPKTLRSAEIAKQAKLHPYVIEKAQAVTKQMTKQQLIHTIEQLRAIDRLQKTKPLQLDDVLRNMIVTITKDS